MSTIGHGGGPGDAERDPGLDRLYREGARDEPPARLDAAILAAAHREAGARPRPLSARLHAWRVPMSIAAVVVLSVSLVTVVQEEGGDRLAQPPAPRMDSAARNEAFDLAKTPGQPAASAPPLAAPEPEKAPARKAPAAAAARDQAAEVAGTAQSERALARSGPDTVAIRPAEPAPPAPAPAPPPVPFVRDEPTAPLAATAPATAGSGAGGAATEESRRPAAAPAARPAPRMMAREAAPRADEPPAQAEDAMGALRSQAGAPAAGQPRARAEAGARKAAPAPADAAFVAAQVKALDAQPPERWIERMEALRREGRVADADELLAEFKRRFPAHPLPPSLRPAP